MSTSGFRKEYVLVSSDEKDRASVSTTDFRVKLSVPLTHVVKCDLIQVIMDYKVANIVAPFTGFRIAEDVSIRDLVFEEGLYTPYSLRESLETLLGTGYTVNISTADRLTIERPFQSSEEVIRAPATQIASGNRDFFILNDGLRAILGLTSSSVRPTYNAADGEFGSLTWRFPRSVKLGQTSPYMFIQSPDLGTDIRTAGGQVGFWRMILNDTYNGFVQMVNNRVDTYADTPRTLQDINVRLLFPDGTVVNNRGGMFSMLLEIVRKV
jgi:hypothetical protein